MLVRSLTSLPLALSYPGGLWYSTIEMKERKLERINQSGGE